MIRRFGEDPDKLDAQSLRTFVLSQSRNVGWAKAKRCTTALRMFLRFLIAENRWWIRETSVIFSSSRGNSGSERTGFMLTLRDVPRSWMSPTLRIIRQVHWKREEPSREIVRFCGLRPHLAQVSWPRQAARVRGQNTVNAPSHASMPHFYRCLEYIADTSTLAQRQSERRTCAEFSY